MTKAEKRKARREARAEGRPLVGELALREASTDRDPESREEFSATRRGERALERWARRNYDSDGRYDD